MTEKRLLIVYCCFFAFAVIVQAKIASLMCMGYDVLAEKQTVRTVDISAGRAEIVDCNLNKITGTQDQIKAFITSEKDLQNIYENIRPQDRAKFYSRIQQQRQVVVELTSPLQTETIYTTTKRYSSSNLAQHLIGYLDLDNNGLSGIEKAYNSLLKDNGQQINLHFNVNGNGDIYGDVYSTTSQDSQVLSLTIDNSMQRMAEGIAKEFIPNGSIVIMESTTGKIRAMASTPVYDANNVVAYLDDDNSPLVNKALQSYEPGSVIKPLWAAMLLENGYNKDKVYYCNGYTVVNGHTYHCANHRAHGPVDMAQALVVSCNCYFIDRQVRNKGFFMLQMADQMHFGENIKICDDIYTSKGNFPDTSKIENLGVQSSVSFGQGDFRVSPVHIAAYMNIFANNGVYIYPQVVEGMFSEKTGNMTLELYSYHSKRVITPHTSKTLKDMLIQVVEKGAGERAKPTFLSAGGKTGTAQTGKTKENGEEIFTAWYGGFYPADNPQYVIAITIQDGGESTYTAAPLFKKICDSIYYLKFADTCPVENSCISTLDKK